ncbi:TOMM precursor leader peptide-binding protein [Streptomyces sp. NPDC006539]|uniref:TOMM precursor leader peptide-binding protein n=1 Tax=Streptomyces sp. NPDC006539 TaxID=3155352 RepID=UPI0033BDAEF3
MHSPAWVRPRLKAHLTARVVGTEQVLLLAEDRNYLVHGAACAAVMPYLDGQRSIANIVEATADRISFSDCLRAVSKLYRSGHLVDGSEPGLDRGQTALWESQGLTVGEANARQHTATVTVTSIGGIATGHTVAALRAAGLRVRNARPEEVLQERADLVVVLTDEYLDPRLSKVDEEIRASGHPWLLAKPVGLEIWVGPLFQPGNTGCWHCLRDRLDGNRPVDQYLRVTTGQADPPRVSVAASAASLNLAGNVVANAVMTFLLSGESAGLNGKLVSLSTRSLQTEDHHLVRQPQCVGCGDPSLAVPPVRIALRHGSADVTSDGGWRVVPAERTYRRLEKHVGRLLGAVTTLRAVEEEQDGIVHSYRAAHHFALQAHNIDGLRRTLRGHSGGKGRTDVQARVSGLCEALERYCAVWRPPAREVVARYADLPPGVAVAPQELLLFSRRQYAARANHDSTAGRLHHVPAPLDPTHPVSWVPAWSLTWQQERLVPAAYAWFGHPDLQAHGFCFPDSNGNASGNSLEEAILHGFCELVERDSVALWWYNRVVRPAFDLDSLGDPYIDSLRRLYASSGRELWVLDITADLGVPAYAAVSRRVDHPTEDILLGFGAHLDASVAVMRSLTELNQFLPAVRRRRPDGSTDYWEHDRATLAWWRETTVADNSWLLPGPCLPATTAASHAAFPGQDLAAAVQHCVDLARNAGLEVIVLDQSRPDIELAVVKVMVPGLRHFWRRLGPGRLYDVPVRLGWVDTPIAEDACNPVSVFF